MTALTDIGTSSIRRLKTGIPGLDEVLGGGLPEFSFNLIAGEPGCGKTTLAHQIMFALATPERPALYFTVLGEPPIKMLRYQQQFSFFDLDKVNRAIRFVNLSEVTATGDLAQVMAKILAEVEARGPGLVFIDSFRSMVLAGEGEAHSQVGLQKFIQDLGVQMTCWQATTFLIGEYFNADDPNPIFTVADGLIWLRQSTQGNSVVRKMEIRKMRGQPTLSGLHTFRIGPSGLQVFAPIQPTASPQAGSERPESRRLSFGVPLLDGMLGGGLPVGYTLLLAGPSGSGKSLLASAFLVEGARHGETGVIAAFEQHPNRARGRELSGLIESGRIGVVETGAQSLSVDEMATLLTAEIRRLKATRVVIDSLSGFELALAPTFREDFRESLARLVAALTSTGATVVMTSELEDRYTDLRFSPYGTAFLTDAIIVLRYVEVEGRLLRVLAVVKVRDSAHSDELRNFTIDNDGIQIGQRMIDLEGLLCGTPSRTYDRLDRGSEVPSA